MRWLIQGAFHPNVEWLIPPGEPAYKPAPDRHTEGKLYQDFKKLYIFCKGGADGMDQKKREKHFVQFLEAVYPSDARMLLDIKDKKLPYGLTYDLMQEAFPGILPDLPVKFQPIPEPKGQDYVKEVVKVVEEATKPVVEAPNTEPWFAPAGFPCGVLTDVKGVMEAPKAKRGSADWSEEKKQARNQKLKESWARRKAEAVAKNA